MYQSLCAKVRCLENKESRCAVHTLPDSLLTGFKINFLPFKLCPVIFISSSLLILIGCYV